MSKWPQPYKVFNELINQQSNLFCSLAQKALRLACLRKAFNNGKCNTIYSLKIPKANSRSRWRSGNEYRLSCWWPGFDPSQCRSISLNQKPWPVACHIATACYLSYWLQKRAKFRTTSFYDLLFLLKRLKRSIVSP